MDYNILFSLMKEKKFNYFSGNINIYEDNENLITFSTKSLNKGNMISITVLSDNKLNIKYWLKKNLYTIDKGEKEGLTENELILLLKEKLG